MAFWGVNRLVMGVFLLTGVGMILAGFLVSPEMRTSDGNLPLNQFFWGFGAFWILSSLASLLVVQRINARHRDRLDRWMPGTAKVLSASETGTTVNDMPRIKFVLEVTSSAHGVYQVEHRALISLLRLASYTEGSVHEVRVDPDDPKKLVFAN